MADTSRPKKWRLCAKFGASLMSLLLAGLPVSGQNPGKDSKEKEDRQKTETPIKHVQ